MYHMQNHILKHLTKNMKYTYTTFKKPNEIRNLVTGNCFIHSSSIFQSISLHVVKKLSSFNAMRHIIMSPTPISFCIGPLLIFNLQVKHLRQNEISLYRTHQIVVSLHKCRIQHYSLFVMHYRQIHLALFIVHAC